MQPITNQRSFARFSIPYADSKHISTLNNVSLNDVVMAISGEGMNRYFKDEGFSTEDPLLAAIPVSVRPEGNTELSNQVSIARMSLRLTLTIHWSGLRQSMFLPPIPKH